MNDSLFPRDIVAAQVIAQPTSPAHPDSDLLKVHDWFKGQPDFESRFGRVLRQSIDEVLDGQRTGRFNLEELAKTEKTYLGTKVEIIARAEFDLGQGKRMDFSVNGHEVDSKFTSGANWTIPREADKHICLLIKAHDRKATYQVGLLRIHTHYLNSGENRDGKRSLSAAGRGAIKWLVKEGRLPENILLTLPKADLEAIFERGKSGQSRTNELFLRVQGKPVNRNTVLTVARQDDSPKRVRDARKHLRRHGIVILGHQSHHPTIARTLGVPVPDKGSWVSIRITEVNEIHPARSSVEIGGRLYTKWMEGDPPSTAPAAY